MLVGCVVARARRPSNSRFLLDICHRLVAYTIFTEYQLIDPPFTPANQRQTLS